LSSQFVHVRLLRVLNKDQSINQSINQSLTFTQRHWHITWP